jgi:hypothetical protein
MMDNASSKKEEAMNTIIKAPDSPSPAGDGGETDEPRRFNI